ncbi:hypothetical protein PABG_02345 [Paracoccidioides brasiliensis Pb03]|nr:hypothetical protein PABG_02345 [Paracoccidioides brasiliensis Pb03]ODH49451.1 hypothetical protein GX48_04393 [Paracoccidioides brasiliensis]
MPNKLASTEMFDEMAKWVLDRVRRTALVHVSWRMPVHSSRRSLAATSAGLGDVRGTRKTTTPSSSSR